MANTDCNNYLTVERTASVDRLIKNCQNNVYDVGRRLVGVERQDAHVTTLR